jgi:hypothetical protein
MIIGVSLKEKALNAMELMNSKNYNLIIIMEEIRDGQWVPVWQYLAPVHRYPRVGAGCAFWSSQIPGTRCSVALLSRLFYQKQSREGAS